MEHATATLPSIQPQDISADDSLGYVDGIVVALDLTHTASDPSVGYTGGFEASVDLRTIRLADRAHWDAAHPAVEPTDETMLAVVKAAESKIAESACEFAEDHPPEPDFDDGGYDDAGEDY